MASAQNITEDDLLERFDEIQRQMDELMRKHSIHAPKESGADIESSPLVVEPVFSYEIHTSG